MDSEVTSQAQSTAGGPDGYEAGILAVVEAELKRMKADTETESARISAEAKRQADDITSQAEARAVQEAREKTRHEADRAVAAAREESTRIISEATHEAEEQSARILADARTEAEKAARALLDEATKAANDVAAAAADLRAKAEHEAAETRDKALRQAEQIVKEAVESARTRASQQEAGIVAEAEREGARILGQAEGHVRDALGEAARAVRQAAQRLSAHTTVSHTDRSGQVDTDGATGTIPTANDAVQGPPPQSQPAQVPPSLEPAPPAQHAGATRADAAHDGTLTVKQVLNSSVILDDHRDSILYTGEVELHIVPPADAARLGEFEEHLEKITHIRIRRTPRQQASDVKIFVLVDAALPLFGIVRKLPPVEEAEQIGKDIMITLLPAREARPGGEQEHTDGGHSGDDRVPDGI